MPAHAFFSADRVCVCGATMVDLLSGGAVQVGPRQVNLSQAYRYAKKKTKECNYHVDLAIIWWSVFV